MIRFALTFMFVLGASFWAYILVPVQNHIILPFTSALAWICTGLIHVFDDNVIASGKIILSPQTGWAVSIEPGCNGVEAVIILAAAVIAFPAPWKHRVVGFVLGFFAIQGLNIVRIISLFYIGLWEGESCTPGVPCDRVWFEWFHLYLWQALIILDALVVWLIWLRYLPRTPRPAAAPKPALG